MLILQLRLDGTPPQRNYFNKNFAEFVLEVFDAYEFCHDLTGLDPREPQSHRRNKEVIENNVVELMARFVTDLCESQGAGAQFLSQLDLIRVDSILSCNKKGLKKWILSSMVHFRNKELEEALECMREACDISGELRGKTYFDYVEKCDTMLNAVIDSMQN